MRVSAQTIKRHYNMVLLVQLVPVRPAAGHDAAGGADAGALLLPGQPVPALRLGRAAGLPVHPAGRGGQGHRPGPAVHLPAAAGRPAGRLHHRPQAGLLHRLGQPVAPGHLRRRQCGGGVAVRVEHARSTTRARCLPGPLYCWMVPRICARADIRRFFLVFSDFLHLLPGHLFSSLIHDLFQLTFNFSSLLSKA